MLVSVTKCAAGKKFVAAQNGNPAKCEACGSGTFNANDDDSTVCTAHNTCADSSVEEAGTLSKDAVCNGARVGGRLGACPNYFSILTAYSIFGVFCRARV